MRSKALISIIVPVYNGERTIEKCLTSILSQELEQKNLRCNIEIIVINDGSTDDTSKLLHDFAIKDNRIILVEQSNQGVSAARNKGLTHAKGDYLTFCDSDDWVEKDWIISMYQSITEYNADIVKFSCIIEGHDAANNYNNTIIWNRGEAIREFLIHKKMNGILWTSIYKKELFAGLQFNTNICLYEDAEMVWQILHRANRIVRVNDAKYHYVITGDSLSNGKFTIGKLKSSIIFWDKVYNDVEKYHPEYSELALGKRLEVYSNCLIKMIIDGVDCKEQEQKIRQYLMNNIKSLPKHQGSIAKRAYTYFAIFCPHITRVIGRMKK